MKERKALRLRAFAKANLSLDITGRSDGMHLLDGISTSLDCFDTVTVKERADGNIFVRFVNADIDPENNTAYKAARAVQAETDCGGFDIEIEKGIPVGAGLGGSSADGAAVLRALDVFYRLPSRGVDMRALALSVGSDVPFMLTGGTGRVSGTGGELYFFKNKLPLFAAGLMAESVSTRECYALFDDMYRDAQPENTDNDRLAELLMTGDPEALRLFSNALYAPAARLAPSVEKFAAVLEEVGARPCLTGSGGMVLGWFTDIEKLAACAARLKTEPGFKVFTTTNTGILHEWLK